ncbi:MAG: peptide ABC transporter substrate-binding protein [Anaerolineae bacterium]
MNGQRSTLIIVLIVLLACGLIVLGLVGCGAAYLLISSRATSTAMVVEVTSTPVTVTATHTPTVVAQAGTPVPAATRATPAENIATPTRAAIATKDLTLGQRSRGGELRLPGGMPLTLDPALSTDSTSAQYIVEIFSGLVTADPNLELIPDIAESYKVSEDGRTYTFVLRPNVRFHDGRVVTAVDIKFSLERSCNPETGSVVASTYLGDIVGAKEMLAGGASELAGVRVLDDRTIEIEIDAPRPSFLAKLSHPVAFVVDSKSISSRDPLKRANGTGPFRLEEVTPYERIVLAANPHYYREPMPMLDRVVFVMSGGYPVTMYENDELDVAAVGTDDLPRITDPANETSQELAVSEQLATFYVGLNCALPPFDDIKVRQAFAQALDRQKIVDLIYDRTVPAANTIVPPLMPDYDTSGLSAPPLDVAAAQKLLSESSYGGADGLPPITLHLSSSGPETDPVAEAIAVILEDNLGVSVRIEQSDWSDFLGELNKPDQPFQMYLLGWIADYPDPENFLNVLFQSRSADNHSRYANEEVDDLLAQAGLEMDQGRRYELYRQAERIILAEAPIIPLYHDVEYWLTKPYVRGMYYPAMIVPRLQYVSMER